MASDYGKIKADNIRDYGEKTHHLAFLGRLYTDRTHFVFELLQNAEDKKATRVLFRLFEDRLEVQHDGEIFDDRDVRGICGVGEGTKADDLTKIGKFGIGFKAVYAYTSVPEVHSGDEHFHIEHYVRPSAAPTKPPGAGWTTLFMFGFDPAKVPAETASREIAATLRGLTARTLLFLRNIKEIEYVLPDGTRGIYLREQTELPRGRLVTVIGESAGKEESERWLVFERPVPIPDSTESVAVEIGFKLKAGPKDKTEGIARVKESPLYVFFPTEKQTQFGFLIQGPYRTTPARDNVPKDDEWNATLVSATAALIVEALHAIKERGLLTVTALNALPIRLDTFSGDGMFHPIVTAVRDALRADDLLPAEDGSYVAAPNAKLGRGAELRKLLGQDQLATLFPTGLATKWLSGEITQDRTSDLRIYLLNELQVEEVDPDGFARKISRAFLSAQSDEWFVSFYRFLSDQEALWKPKKMFSPAGILRGLEILRLENDAIVAPFQNDGTTANAYLPPPEGTDLPSVKKTITGDEEAAAFLKLLGLDEPDIFDDIVHRVLPKYTGQTVSVSADEHAADIQKIFRALASDSDGGKKKVYEEARKTPFLKASNCAGQTAYKCPGETYRDDSDLRLYFEGFAGAWFVDEPIPEGAPGDVICNGLGIARRPRRIPFQGDLPKEEKERTTGTETVENFLLDGFDSFVENLKHDNDHNSQIMRSLYLWMCLSDDIRLDQHFFSGKYEWYYYSNKCKRFDSLMLRRLRQTEWIPTADGSMKMPDGLSVNELRPEFRDADDLIKLLHIATESTQGVRRRLYANALGVSLDDIEFLRQHPEDFQQWRQSLAERAVKPTFPTRTSADVARREARVAEQWHEATEKEYGYKEMSVRTSRGTVDPHSRLIEYYTNDDGQMICQLCANEMPFKKRNEEYYFVEMEALGREHFSKEHPAQFLALCPICAAKYKEFVKSDGEAMNAMKLALLGSEEPAVPVMLGNSSEKLKFDPRHFGDIKTILREEAEGDLRLEVT